MSPLSFTGSRERVFARKLFVLCMRLVLKPVHVAYACVCACVRIGLSGTRFVGSRVAAEDVQGLLQMLHGT